MFLLEEVVVMHACQNDDVAERDGWARGKEQRLDEAHGHRPQGEEAPRVRLWICCGSSYQHVSPSLLLFDAILKKEYDFNMRTCAFHITYFAIL